MFGHTHITRHHKSSNNISRELQYKQNGEEYAIVSGDKGNGRFLVTIYSTNESTMAKARGAIIHGPRRQRIEKDDLVLIQKDESTSLQNSKDKYFIIHKYSYDEMKRLEKAGLLVQIKEEKKEDKKDKTINKHEIAFESETLKKKEKIEKEIDMDFIANI